MLPQRYKNIERIGEIRPYVLNVNWYGVQKSTDIKTGLVAA